MERIGSPPPPPQKKKKKILKPFKKILVFTVLRSVSCISELFLVLFDQSPIWDYNHYFEIMFLRTWSQRSWLTKSLATEVLAQLETQSFKGYVLKNLVTKGLAHEEPGHRGPGSIKISII